ncbi:MAG: hypothetical protein EOP09_19350, partial [Proteobacteria bacterium]
YSGLSLAEKTSPGPLIHEKNGIKIGYLAYAWGANGFFSAGSWLLLNVCKELIGVGDPASKAALYFKVGELKNAGADLIVLSLHWGHEFERYPADFQRSLARELVDAGVDLIIGHHITPIWFSRLRKSKPSDRVPSAAPLCSIRLGILPRPWELRSAERGLFKKCASTEMTKAL